MRISSRPLEDYIQELNDVLQVGKYDYYLNGLCLTKTKWVSHVNLQSCNVESRIQSGYF